MLTSTKKLWSETHSIAFTFYNIVARILSAVNNRDIFIRITGRYKMKRASGILMHITSLPGESGIGTFGKESYYFVDFLEKAGQAYWQILPLGPTGYRNSPYQSFSSFAGNPYLIDFDLLAEEGLLQSAEFNQINFEYG